MICEKCGTESENNKKFCYKCGARLSAGQTGSSGQAPLLTDNTFTGQQPGYQPQQPPYYMPPAIPNSEFLIPNSPPQQQPGYQQQQHPPYYTPPAIPNSKFLIPNSPAPPKKKSKTPLLIGIAGLAVAALVFFLAILPIIQKLPVVITPSDNDDDNGTTIVISITPTGNTPSDNPSSGTDNGNNIYLGLTPPGVGEAPFTACEVSFSTDDPGIRMIEINQSLSYGFNSDTGEFFLIDNFIAGKETAIFIDLAEPLDPRAEVLLTIERNGEYIATLASVDIIDDSTLLFQPRDISEVGFWQQGAYTFTFHMDGSTAVRTTNFYKSSRMKVLAVPMINYYSGQIRICEGEWKLGVTMLTALYPVARDDVEYVLGPEQDLSDKKYDLDTESGRRKVWQAINALQPPNGEYTMIIGFMRRSTAQGYLGYAYPGGSATIVCESSTDMLATVVHEIAHCYYIGDEYPGGGLNNILNPPPYGMEGHDILTGKPTTGMKKPVKGGSSVGLNGTGSVVYPEQRAYWLEGRTLLGTLTSYMGAGTNEDSFMFWTSSDIWNHLYGVFTGQLTGDELRYGASGSGAGAQRQGEYWGKCYYCACDVYDPFKYIECPDCANKVLISGETFSCSDCNAGFSLENVKEENLWIFHSICGNLLHYPAFVEYNSDSGSKIVPGDDVTVLEIRGIIDPTGAGSFEADPWYSYGATRAALTSGRDGEYSAAVYDRYGKRLSVAYFNIMDANRIVTRGGSMTAGDIEMPVQIVVNYPDNAAKIVIKRGAQVIFTKEVSPNAPVVAFTGLSKGQELSNNTTFTWEGSDADGDSLTYQIWYYRGENEQYLVATDLTGTTKRVDLTDFPGTDSGWFVIFATDGLRTGRGESPKVSVPYKAPDILNYIPEGKQYKVTEMVEISGKVYDAQDGWLWGNEYEWYVDGKFWHNYGLFYFWHAPYQLFPGEHTITMVVTNSAGVSSGKDFLIEIIDDESDLPDDWSRNDLTLALRIGYYLPLNRLDSPVTRIDFAKMMFHLYSLVLPDDFDLMPMGDLIATFTDMSNDPTDMDYGYALTMISLGLMDLRDMEVYAEYQGYTFANGAFDPYGTLTQREAMQIFFKTIELSLSNSYDTYEVLDESVFIPGLTEWGLFDDEPGHPNTYQANEKLSARLLMVRIARFVKFWEELEDKDYGSAAGFFNNFYRD